MQLCHPHRPGRSKVTRPKQIPTIRMKRRNSRLIFPEQSKRGNDDSETLASTPPDDHLLAGMDKVVPLGRDTKTKLEDPEENLNGGDNQSSTKSKMRCG